MAPVSRLSIVLGKVMGASTVGLAQGLAFLLLAGAAGLHPGFHGYALAFAVLTLASVGLTGLGFCIAWVLDSSQGFHAVMNLFLIPMWMLSGALFRYRRAALPAGGHRAQSGGLLGHRPPARPAALRRRARFGLDGRLPRDPCRFRGTHAHAQRLRRLAPDPRHLA